MIKIDGEVVFEGVFRSAYLSAIPEPPKISIKFPSLLIPSGSENYHAIRMFYPGCHPPSDQPEKNLKLSQHFEGINKPT